MCLIHDSNKIHILHLVDAFKVFFSFIDSYSLLFFFFCFCHSFVEETSHLSCKVSHILDSADCVPLVFLNLFLRPFISCTQVVSSRGLSRIRFDFLAKSLELLRQRNEVTKSKSYSSFRKEDTSLASLGFAGGRQRDRAPQTSIGLASGMLGCWWGSRLILSRLISSHLVSSHLISSHSSHLREGSLGPNDPTS